MVVNGKYSTPSQSIAIIGVACRFPGDASSPSKLWEMCAEGRDGWSTIPHDRFDVKSLYDVNSEKVGRNHANGGHFLKEDVTKFDAAFFNLPADVATAMDPQIRFLLETVYEATEDAGIPLEKLAGSNTSVFSGCYSTDYQNIQFRDPESLSTAFLTSNYTTMFANRISHFYDLQGASATIDTACSSGLVALHQGCQTIRSGESEMSIIGASNLILSQDMFIAMSNIGLIGTDGRCYAWDTRASGYGRGEGVAALILKSVDAAVRDGDRIHAVIRNSALNQDGKTATITSPSADAQVKLIETCYKRAGLDLSDTGYVEAHMTGTQAGDATEAEAIARTFGKSATGGPVLVGSLKTNVGHTEPVSGLAAVIKTIFALKHGQIAPNLNYENPNLLINLKEWNIQVPTQLMPWPQGKPLRASINNFGYGGSNAHVILESTASMRPRTNGINGHATYQNGTQGSNGSRVYILSAKDSGACKEMMNNVAEFLRQSIQEGNEPSPTDLAYTLAERRSRFPWAVAVRASNLEELAERLEQPTAKAPLHAARGPRLGFVFNGQGAQWYAMGRELITAYSIFGDSIRKADRVLRDYGAAWSLHDELMRDERSTRVGEINLSQPISVALQLCLVDLLGSWGIVPSIVTSHSSGEIAAAYATNALSFEEALGVVYLRGELALKYQKISPFSGGMLATGVGVDEAEKYVAEATSGRIVVAAINSPESVTLSGDLSAIDEVASRLEKDGVFARKLKVPLAYHSHHMLPMAQEYIDKMRSIIPKHSEWNENIVFASPVTGDIISPEILTPEHWARNLTSPVRFSEAFESVCRSDVNVNIVVEVGAHSTLAGPIRQILNGRKMDYVSCLKRSTDAVETMQNLVCELLTRGYPVDLKAVNAPLGNETQIFTPDLPTYPWNHSIRYWQEPRISKDYRHKSFPPHELLGLPISGSTEPIATWRNFLRLSDLPWLNDHQVDSKAVFPGAGYISMAIEAVRLLTNASSHVRGFRLRDVNIVSALAIPDSSNGIEIHTRLRPCNESEMDHKGWYEFEIGSIATSSSWVRNCYGYVSAEMDKTNKSPLFHEMECPREDSFLSFDVKARTIDVPSIYATLRQMTIYHGPAFQNLLEGLCADEKAILSLSIPTVASETFDYIVHPTTLDTIIQTTFATIPKDISQGSMVLPRSIGHMFVPCNLDRQAGSMLKAFVELRKSSRRGFATDIAVSNVDSSALPSSFLHMEDFHCQAVPMGDKDDVHNPEFPVCSKTYWEMDITHQIPPVVKDTMKIFLSDEEASAGKKLIRASYHLIYDAVAQLKGEEREGWAWHHKILYNWMEKVVALGISGALSPGCKSWSRTSKGMKQMLNDELEAGDAAGQLTVRVGRALAAIVRGEAAPLEVMMEGNLLNRYYMEFQPLKNQTYKHLRRVVEHIAIKNPGANVLEIGAGTGGATKTVLEAFSPRGDGSGSLLGHYTFTDISAGFFEAAAEKLASWKGMVNFATLDIDSDPATQSLTDKYDLIVASMVLHATKSLQKTLSHVRKLLKPGGKLLLIEATQDRLDVQLCFGTLPGWWLSEEPFRKDSPNVALNTWDDVLKSTGFSGVEFDISDCEEVQFHHTSLIMATAVETPGYPSNISIVYTAPDSQPWLTQLAAAVQHQTGTLSTVESLDEFQSSHDKVCIVTAEMSAPFLDGIDQASFEKIKNLLVNSRGILWLSSGSIIDSEMPSYAQTQGLLRTLRQENSGIRYVHLDFEYNSNPWSEDKIALVLHALQQSFDYKKEHGNIEWDYAVRDSILHVPRIYADKHEDSSQVDVVPQLQPFHQSGRILMLEPPSSGSLNDLCFTDGMEPTEDIPSGMIEIEAKAFGLNRRDIMIASGQLDHDSLVGHDCAGIVRRLGQHAEQSGLKIGDRVCGIAQGNFASSSLAHWASITKLPDDISWEDGAAIPTAYVTAYHSLLNIGRLSKGESVLIHAAAGGVGQAAIVLAQQVGAQIFVTCSTEAKKNILVENYKIDAMHVFSSRDASFASAIMTATGGKGVDVVLNSLSGALLKATWRCIARFGRFVELGKVDIEAARCLDTTPFGRCATYAGFDILQLNEFNHPLTHEALTESMRIYHGRVKAGTRRPMYPIEWYPISDIEKAMKHMQGGSHIGKIVLVPRNEDKVMVADRPLSISLANSDAAYLVVGGLGGIGRAIATWMIENGAKNIILVSRHAESHQSAMELSQRGKKEGCNVHVKNCDVSDEKAFLEFLAHCSSISLPPIKGVVNGAMLLDDTILEHMTYEQWQRAVKTKVRSSINIHNHLPGLLFFVMLSSISGIVGNASQSNYNAGNTFEDALARHRARSGQSAVSLNLSGVRDVGYIATEVSANADKRITARIEGLGTISIDMDTILRVVENAVLRNPKRARPDDAQVIIGLAPWDRIPEDAIIRQDPRVGTMRLATPRSSAAASTENTGSSPTSMLAQALEASTDSIQLAAKAVAARLATIFAVSADEMDLAAPMASHGVDSLVSVQLRNWFTTVAKAKVSVLEIAQSSSLTGLAELVLERSQIVQTA